MVGQRCPWAEHGGIAERAYHDTEWGTPLHGEAALFELLSLEGAQAGLSWSTILARRQAYRDAFANFDPSLLATWPQVRVDALMGDASIVRHRGKISSVLSNARAVRDLGEDGLGLDAYLWSFTGNQPLQPRIAAASDVPSQTELSVNISSELKARGFKFVGPKIVYALMQAAGLTNDHVTSCFRFAELVEQPPGDQGCLGRPLRADMVKKSRAHQLTK